MFFVGEERRLRVEDKIVEEIKRHFDVVAEDLKDEIKLVAEGYSLLNEKIDGLRKENAEEHATLNKRIDGLRKENAEEHATLNKRIDELREENAEEHQEILSAVKFSYAELDHRIVALEEKFADIEKRVSRIEAVR